MTYLTLLFELLLNMLIQDYEKIVLKLNMITRSHKELLNINTCHMNQ